MSDYISIKDDRLWDILFDEACVEGQQAERIFKELEQITVDEKEIIRKTVERIVERLEEETDCPNCSMHCVDAPACGFVVMNKRAIEIVKEEGGIDVF